ncbi:c-type cytochrome [Oceanimonas marisflavi]|uniref:c-type cytochrome n=1 Tax=Oceanimonas marisflavi TaxID=2059724 RepID=UPI000D311E8F|nr:c-type cytochrome [Oceanimonas marisflavi]
MIRISAITLGLSLVLTGMAHAQGSAQAAHVDKLAIQEELPVGQAAGEYPVPPGWDKLPEGEFGEKVVRGYNYFVNSQSMAPEFVGNGLNCVNCHMDGGKKENAAPLWAAYMSYPAYRKKNDRINSYEERIQGCFLYSMNGTPPGHMDPVLVDLSAYAYWLAQGTLTGEQFDPAKMEIPSDEDLLKGGKRDDFPFMQAYLDADGSTEPSTPGRGYPKLAEPEQAPAFARGKQVYEQECAVCHGASGEGQKVNDRYVFPPLWGPETYNWGAGMQRVNTAAYFIKQNMPLGQPGKLTDQQAWDVAMYLDSHERPQDPRNHGSLEETVEKFHGGFSQYGKEVNGSVLGTASYPNHPNKP